MNEYTELTQRGACNFVLNHRQNNRVFAQAVYTAEPLTLNNALDYQTNGHYRTCRTNSNPNPSPLVHLI